MTEQLPFHATPIGTKYYEETLPNLIKSLNRLAEKSQRGKCHWMGCKEPGEPSLISLPGGPAVKVCLCEKHTKEVAKVLGPQKKRVIEDSRGFDPATGQVRGYIDVEITKKEEQRVARATSETPLLTEAEKIIIDQANEKMRAKVTPAKKSMEQNLVETIKEEEKKKKDAELGRVAMELGRLDVQIADLAQKLAIKKQTRLILERKGQLLIAELANEDDEATNRG